MKTTRLLEEQKDVHPPFPFQPVLLRKRVWRKNLKIIDLIVKNSLICVDSEYEYSSNEAYANHWFIRGAEVCASPVPFSTDFIENKFLTCFWLSTKLTWCWSSVLIGFQKRVWFYFEDWSEIDLENKFDWVLDCFNFYCWI